MISAGLRHCRHLDCGYCNLIEKMYCRALVKNQIAHKSLDNFLLEALSWAMSLEVYPKLNWALNMSSVSRLGEPFFLTSSAALLSTCFCFNQSHRQKKDPPQLSRTEMPQATRRFTGSSLATRKRYRRKKKTSVTSDKE